MKFFYIIVFTVMIGTTVSGCKEKTSLPVSQSNFYLGTLVSFSVYGDVPNDKIFEEAFALVAYYEELFSKNIESSDVSAINRNSGTVQESFLPLIGGTIVSPETAIIVEKSLTYSEMTSGLFDITVEPLIKLWGIGADHAKVPTLQEIGNALTLVGWKEVVVLRDLGVVALPRSGMAIDLGAVAKGYIADKVKEMFIEQGIKSAIINLGGNVLLLGEKPNKVLFRVGIQNPFSPRGSYLGVISGKDFSVATSGIYERYFEEDGKAYHHILNPKTGYPAESDIAGISVVTKESFEGDCLSTSLFMMGSTKALEFIKSRTGVEAVIITKEKKVLITEGLSESFKLTDKEFTLISLEK